MLKIKKILLKLIIVIILIAFLCIMAATPFYCQKKDEVCFAKSEKQAELFSKIDASPTPLKSEKTVTVNQKYVIEDTGVTFEMPDETYDNMEVIFEGRLFEKVTASDFQELRNKIAPDREYHARWMKGEFLGVFKYEVIKVCQVTEGPADDITNGYQMNVVIPNPDVKKDGFTQRTGTVKTFKVGDVHRLRVTRKLPQGWEAWKLIFERVPVAIFACLSADIVKNTDDSQPVE